MHTSNRVWLTRRGSCPTRASHTRLHSRRSTHAVLLAACGLLAGLSTAVHAQDQGIAAGFADDFSVDPFRYSAYSFDGSSIVGRAQARDGALYLSTTANGGPDPGNVYIQFRESTDSLFVTVALDPATRFDSNNAFSGLAVEQRIYNDLADGGLGDGDSEGDVQVRFDIGYAGDGTSGHNVCVGRQGIGEFTPVNLFDGENCFSFDDVVIEPDVAYTVGFSFDRVAKTLTVGLDDNTRTVNVPGDVFSAANPFTGFQAIQEVGDGEAVFRVSEVRTDSGVDSFTTPPVLDRYRRFFDEDGDLRTATVANGQLRLQARATDSDEQGMAVSLLQPTGYLEATVALSAETTLGTSRHSRAEVELRMNLFNDTADGGFNGREGDVDALITLQERGNGRQRIEYCLRRADDADADNRSGLLNDDEHCRSFPVLFERDTAYRIAIDFDRANATVTFRVNGLSHEEPLGGDMFTASRADASLAIYPRDLASVVLDVDDLRTAPEALTNTELSAGLAVPAAFPDAPDPASQVAESELTVPVFTENMPLDFIDDFSTPSARYGFWNGRDRGEAGVANQNDYLELQANSASEDEGNYAEFYILEQTDLLQARVSLSSDSQLPPSDKASATIRLQGVFYNDTIDGGFNDNAGDVFASLQIRLRGDGRRAVELYLERRNAEGGRDVELELLPEGENALDDFAVELDKLYTLAIRLDRERQVLVFSIDDVDQEVTLPTEVFHAYRDQKQIQVQHRGSSGRAIGRIYAVTTDDFIQDFSDERPVLGPYRPVFDSGYAGVDVRVTEGRLLMSVESSLSSGRGARLWTRGVSDYVGASTEISSESMPTAMGKGFIGVGGLVYNDLADGGTDGAMGSVFAAVSLGVESGPNGVGYFAEYCAFRSTDADFGDSVELIGGDSDTCPRFTSVVVPDVPYALSIELDPARNVLSFRLGDELIEYAITTDVFEPHRRLSGARAQANDDASVVGYIDDLSFSSVPVLLAESDGQLGGLPNDSTNTGGNTGGETAPVDSGSGGSSGGGKNFFGCSIAGKGDAPLLPLMALLALAGLALRRYRVVF